MTRRQKDPLRQLTDQERLTGLCASARSQAEPAAHVARAKALLAVADGQSYTDAAKAAGRRSGEAVSRLVSRFNREGLAAIEPRHGGGPPTIYADARARAHPGRGAPQTTPREGRHRQPGRSRRYKEPYGRLPMGCPR